MAMVNRFDVFLINMDDRVTDDPKNSRPAVVISPDEANRNLGHVLIAPLSGTKTMYPTRVPIDFLNSERCVVLDQLRAIDQDRLVKKIGKIEGADAKKITSVILEYFAE